MEAPVYSQLCCTVCEPLALDRPDRELTTQRLYTQGVPLHEIAKQAEENPCQTCVLLNSAIELAIEHRLYGREPINDLWEIKRWEFETGQNFCAFIMSKPKPPSNRIIFELFRKPEIGKATLPWDSVREDGILTNGSDLGAHLRAIPARLSLPERTDDDDCLARIRSWQKYCTTHHKACSAADGGALPSRVVEIVEIGDPPTVRLYETDREPGSYICLSHCWGSPDIVVKTRKATLEDHKQQIEWASLSKTFRDAIYVTSKLGYKYIWIDSLCIIQDSPEDWRAEAAKMADIYEGAAFVLSAVSSADGNGGLFRQRQSGLERPIMNVEGSTIIARSEIDKSLARTLAQEPGHAFSIPMKDYPLTKRKWCFQERMLATRIVYFSAHELLWECKTEAFCECGRPNEQKPSSNSERLGSDKVDVGNFLSSLSLDSEETRHRLLYEWHRLVTRYSGADLSFVTDMLPAISGVAQRFNGRGLGQYLAGMWEIGLPLALCWQANFSSAENTPKSRRPDKYTAPTWSWASTQGPVAMQISPQRVHFWERACLEVTSARCWTDGTSPFGQVLRGDLVIRAPALEARILDLGDMWPHQVTFSIDNAPQFCYFDSFDDTIELLGKDVWLACVCRQGEEEGKLGMFLILRNNDHDTFRRIGILHTMAESGAFFAKKIETAARKNFVVH